MIKKTSLDKQVAVISGGGTGIGRAICLALADEGAIPVICGRRIEPLEQTMAEVNLKGRSGLVKTADLSAETEVDDLVQAVMKEFGRIDILVNNAGLFETAQTHTASTESWDRVMNINLRAVFLLTKAVLPVMRSQRRGQILNISSESGTCYHEDDVIYGVSKHALNDFAEYVQRENQEFNIRVSTICPGAVFTDMNNETTGLKYEKSLYSEDIADLAIWLLSRRKNVKIGGQVLIQTMVDPRK
jgi:3-oxoacyl-[acyl-carrier protein] reductase